MEHIFIAVACYIIGIGLILFKVIAPVFHILPSRGPLLGIAFYVKITQLGGLRRGSAGAYKAVEQNVIFSGGVIFDKYVHTLVGNVYLNVIGHFISFGNIP